MKKLIIAEKPSVAADIARVLGGMKKTGDYYEGDQYVVANALGHLLEIVCPEKYEVKRGKWTFAHLPVLPPQFDLHPIAKSADKLKNLGKLLRRKDIDGVINACDAGREGELIFRYILQACKVAKPVERLWLQSMTPSAISDAFKHLRSDAQMQTLEAAARSRSEADWLVGINGTRAMTAFNSLQGGFFLTTVGRVQTPTLAIVVRREEEIRRFESRPYWEVHAQFRPKTGDAFTGRWFDKDFHKGEQMQEAKAERIFDEAKAQAVVDRVRGKQAVVHDTKKRTTTLSPQLFDLTSLQREANNKFGFSAKTTLALAQSLYEKHKALTYPRTDARALPEDYPDTVRQTLRMVKGMEAYSAVAETVLAEQWVVPNKRIFNNAKISDHFAIIPTLEPPKGALTEAEAKLYDLVVRRFIAVFYPAAEFDVTTRIAQVGDDCFRTEGKVMVRPGWMAVYGKDAVGGDKLDSIADGETVAVADAQTVAEQTKPPARYTEATLLSAMEGAGKLVEDEELRDAMAEKGLGTPATRAAIIENLVDQRYMLREGRDLRPTAKAKQLFTLIEGLGIGVLSDPALTAQWEQKLGEIEAGRLNREDFMREIRNMTTQIVDKAKAYEGDTVPMPHPAHLKHRCPKCGGEIVENYRRYACVNEACDFSLPKHPGGRTFELEEIEELIENGTVGPLTGFISKIGRPFAAVLKLNDEKQLEFVFDNQEERKHPEDLASMPVVGTCPKCGGRLLEAATTYACENAFGEKTCDFRCGRIILQQSVDRTQLNKILTEGRSDLLTDFISNRSHRKFKAFLVLDPKTRKIGFEFAPREGKAGTAKKTTRRKTAKKA